MTTEDPAIVDPLMHGLRAKGLKKGSVSLVGAVAIGLAGVAATMAGTLAPSSLLAVGASRFGETRRDSRGVRAFTAGLAPLTIGLMLATGSVLIRPSGLSWPVAGLVLATLWLMLRTQRSPLWAIALGAAAGAAGWV